MINYSQTTVFNVPVQTIVNTINCVGVMGAGIALEFKLRYPQMYQDYLRQCKKGEVKVGYLYFYPREEQPCIINFPTKNHWKYPSRLDWIEAGLAYFMEHYQQWGIESIAFPKLGCDRGGLDWNKVEKLMQQYLAEAEDLQVYICLDNDPHAQGLEKQMIEILNIPEQWSTLTLLTEAEVKEILKCLPIQRFRNLRDRLSSEQYKHLFDFLHTLVLSQKPQQSIQLNAKDSRLNLIFLLQKLEVSPEIMLELTWENLRQEYNYYWLKLAENQQILITQEIWHSLISLRGNYTIDIPLIHDLRSPQKKLNITTLKKLIKEVKKEEIQQLELIK